MLDYNTVAGADKFGNITVVSFKKKLPPMNVNLK
jgi:hypothetical protein